MNIIETLTKQLDYVRSENVLLHDCIEFITQENDEYLQEIARLKYRLEQIEKLSKSIADYTKL